MILIKNKNKIKAPYVLCFGGLNWVNVTVIHNMNAPCVFFKCENQSYQRTLKKVKKALTRHGVFFWVQSLHIVYQFYSIFPVICCLENYFIHVSWKNIDNIYWIIQVFNSLLPEKQLFRYFSLIPCLTVLW